MKKDYIYKPKHLEILNIRLKRRILNKKKSIIKKIIDIIKL